MRRWLTYLAASVVVLLGATAVALALAPARATTSVWFAAGVALTVQLLAFGMLVAAGRATRAFLAGWLAGIVLRFATVLAVALTVNRLDAFEPRTTLLSLVAFVFLLLLLEPLFLQRTLRTR
jgi:hypothetical protein